MALSNWDTMAFGADGKPAPGHVTAGNTTLSIHKNWIDIRAGKQSITLDDGCITMNGLEVQAKRSDTCNAVMVLVEHNGGFFAGVGCYGYADLTDEMLAHVGRVREPGCEYFTGSSFGPQRARVVLERVRCSEGPRWAQEVLETEDIVIDEFPRDEFENRWVRWDGVTKELHDEFLGWLDGMADDHHSRTLRDWVDLVKQQTPLRQNQGDTFFAEALHEEALGRATTVGEAQEPVLTQLTKVIFGD